MTDNSKRGNLSQVLAYPKVFTQSTVDDGIEKGVGGAEPVTAEGQKDVDAATPIWFVDGVHVVARVVDEHICKREMKMKKNNEQGSFLW